MQFDNFKAYWDEIEKFENSGKYRELTLLLEKAEQYLTGDEYEDNYFDIEFNRARFYIDCDMFQESFNTLKGLIDNNYICPLEWKRFEPLYTITGFQKVWNKNMHLREKARAKSGLKHEIYLPDNYTDERKYPLFIALHGDGENITNFKNYWQPEMMTDKGFIALYLQSAQLTHHNGYGWLKRGYYLDKPDEWFDSPEIYRLSKNSCLFKTLYDGALLEIKECCDSIFEKYSFAEERTIVGGFSGGATAAIILALSRIISVQGFVSLCSQKPVSFTEDKLRKAVERGVRGVFLEGEEELPLQELEDMMKLAEEAGLPFAYYLNRGTGHWYPEDLGQKISRAVSFILKHEGKL